jgi:hypothetical protein
VVAETVFANSERHKKIIRKLMFIIGPGSFTISHYRSYSLAEGFK